MKKLLLLAALVLSITTASICGVIGNDDQINVKQLQRLSSAALPVGRLNIKCQFFSGHATGFLVAPGVMLTNNHCLPFPEVAKDSTIEMDFVEPGDPIEIFELEPQKLFVTDEVLDFTLVAVNPVSQNGARLDRYGYHLMQNFALNPKLGDETIIIGHPAGRPKSVVFSNNQILFIDEDELYYETDSEPGSSGSPVFNKNLQLVALHHAGLSERDDQGRPLARNGKLWTKAMGDSQRAYIANVGVQLPPILKKIQSYNNKDLLAALRMN